MRITNHRGLGDLEVGDQRALDFRRAHAVAGNVDDVVEPAGDPVIAVGIAATAVAGEILAGEGRKIRVDEALVVAVDRAHLARPAVGDAQVALGGAVEHLAVAVADLWLHAEERLGGRARLLVARSKEHTSELQSLTRNSSAAA